MYAIFPVFVLLIVDALPDPIVKTLLVENGDYSGSKRPDGYEGPYESTGMESKDFQLALGYAKGNYSSDFRINFNQSFSEGWKL